MRQSDQILHDALMEAGFDELAGRAAASEWNDYFGVHDGMELTHLVSVLHRESSRPENGPVKRAAAKRLIERVKEGDFDGTREEADEWAQSPEGKATFGKLVGGE